jgi:hypothetical protein
MARFSTACLALLAGLALAGTAHAQKDCAADCHQRNTACRQECARSTGSSEQQMLCRGRCVDQEDECLCGCGQRSYCAGGKKGVRGCDVLVAFLTDRAAPRR